MGQNPGDKAIYLLQEDNQKCHKREEHLKQLLKECYTIVTIYGNEEDEELITNIEKVLGLKKKVKYK